jgi:hypothetical protein
MVHAPASSASLATGCRVDHDSKALRLRQHGTVERLREGVRLFARLKFYAQHGFRLVKPIPECGRLHILRIQPAAQSKRNSSQLEERGGSGGLRFISYTAPAASYLRTAPIALLHPRARSDEPTAALDSAYGAAVESLISSCIQTGVAVLWGQPL